MSNKQNNEMRSITITLPTGKAGEMAYFFLNVAKENFLHVISLDFGTIENLLKLEKTEPFTIQK